MSRRTQLRVRIDDRGALEIVDPGWDSLDLLRSVDPSFEIRCASLTGDTTPRFLQLLRIGCGYSSVEIGRLPLANLWDVHAHAMDHLHSGADPILNRNGATLLELKIELARRIMMNCTLCAQRCGVDRISGETGVCRLGAEAQVVEHFVHIGEESFVNPSLLLSLSGCGLRCRFCQQGAILDPAKVNGECLDESLWAALDTEGARSLSFAGGNPDESLYAILRFLSSAPQDWALPVVWNCHGGATPETVALLHGVVDVWLPDYKYGSEICGRRLSGIGDYPNTAREAIRSMLAQNVPVIVRILIMPAHFKCCHAPVLEALSDLASEGDLWVSVRDQYCPDWRIRSRDGAMTRRPVVTEVSEVWAKAEALGLRLINA